MAIVMSVVHYAGPIVFEVPAEFYCFHIFFHVEPPVIGGRLEPSVGCWARVPNERLLVNLVVKPRRP
jgi:hypothetical protein